MIKTTKIAISLSKEDFNKIELIRKNLEIDRSAIIKKAIRFWLKNWQNQDLIKRYEDGYRKKPESVKEIIAMEKISAQSFEEENWK